MKVINQVIKVGGVLPNGSTVLAVHHDSEQVRAGDNRPQGVVLAWTGREYANWVWISDDRGLVTTGGNYHHDFWQAARSYARRVSQVEGLI